MSVRDRLATTDVESEAPMVLLFFRGGAEMILGAGWPWMQRRRSCFAVRSPAEKRKELDVQGGGSICLQENRHRLDDDGV